MIKNRAIIYRRNPFTLNSNLRAIGAEPIAITTVTNPNTNSAQGYYIKIGKVVFVNFQYRITEAITNGAYNLASGLPKPLGYSATLPSHNASVDQNISTYNNNMTFVSSGGAISWRGTNSNANALYVCNGCYITNE